MWVTGGYVARRRARLALEPVQGITMRIYSV